MTDLLERLAKLPPKPLTLEWSASWMDLSHWTAKRAERAEYALDLSLDALALLVENGLIDALVFESRPSDEFVEVQVQRRDLIAMRKVLRELRDQTRPAPTTLPALREG